MKHLLTFLLFVAGTLSMAQTTKIEISAKNNSDREKSTVALLKTILSEYDLSKWTFTNKVIVEHRVIPHSHPVLTLSTGSTDKKEVMASFIHEQLHWYVEKYPVAVEKAIAKFRDAYKNVPYQNKEGAKDEYSTYLHLIVCYLEYKSMASLTGEEEARQLMLRQTFYTWIYKKVVEDRFIAKVVLEEGFDLVK